MWLPRVLLAWLMIALGPGCAPALFVSQRSDPILYSEPSRGAVTFWGHASVYVDIAGFGIVTDPVFGSRYSPFNGRRIPKPPPSAYDQTDVILISHAHQDHLQPSTLARFPESAVILCPEPSEKYVCGLGPKVQVMRPGDEFPIPGGRIVAVPADHAGGRYARKPLPDGRALGYVIETPRITIYYSGDTDYFWGIEQVGAILRPDLAILNVNAHLRPADALRATLALGASRVIPAHVGAYGGRAAGRGRQWQKEFIRLAGALALPLRVGESVALDSIAVRPKRHGSNSRWMEQGDEPRAMIARSGFLDRLETTSGRILALPDPAAVGISRFAEMEAGLFRGAKPNDAGIRYLKARGFRSVISLRRDGDERRKVEALGLRYFEIPLHAGLFGSTEPTDEEIRTFLSLLADSANRPAFFHCRHGRDRTGAMAALYRIRVDQWPAEDAIEEMRAFGASRFYKDLYRPVYACRERRLRTQASGTSACSPGP